jgi:hypothetical protein
MRCIGSILFVFCYLALGDKLNVKDRSTRDSKDELHPQIHGMNPFPENQRGSVLKNSPS